MLGAIALGLSIALAAINAAIAQGSTMSDQSNGPTINVTSTNQSGGITAYQVTIVGHVDLTFSEKIAEDVAARLPKDRPIKLTGVGSNRDQQVVDQYGVFLRNAGFAIAERNIIGMMSPPPDAPITITVQPNFTNLLIAPRA
jgi:hypothetical protein